MATEPNYQIIPFNITGPVKLTEVNFLPSFPSSSKMGITFSPVMTSQFLVCDGIIAVHLSVTTTEPHALMNRAGNSNFVLIFSYEYKHCITEGFKNIKKKFISITAYKITTSMEKKKLYPNKCHYTVFEKSLPATLTMT